MDANIYACFLELNYVHEIRPRHLQNSSMHICDQANPVICINQMYIL